ncbi:MAG: aspartate aminotransferase family protein [Kiloniellales bacterium]|nr:aspartate aminotransferase family protein [Kiloniellales bacterium]MDJ0969189.1 aspartate aminotransferase family protein [Kiloniellales bacterium]MDJ0983883.1 aspartate aminotransferase family protein [Kiloniellales bacterium]
MIDALMPTYARAELAFERGEGPYLYTAEGRRFLDFASGIAVNALGHSHPHLVEALSAQAQKLWHVSNLYRIPEAERLARRLAESTFADTVFFSNSGAEAIECGLKLVRKYHHATGHPERYRVITCSGAFHGRTLTTISAAANPKYLEGFAPAVEGFDNVAFGNLNELRAAITPETGAILVEPIQGEGGIRPADLAFLRALREVCDEFGLLLFLDEVQCGVGRTGRFFAHEWAEIRPDVMATAKGLGGGFPIGACLATEAAAVGMTAGTHGSTFGGNPLAVAVGNAVLDVVLAEGFLERVEAVAAQLREGLEGLVERHPGLLAGVRGAGLMLGLRCEVPNAELMTRLRDGGLLTVPAAENVLRILPPLIIEAQQVEEALGILEQACADWPKAA